MSDEGKFLVFGVGVCLLIGAIAVGCESMMCESKWGDSGMATSWGPIKGCQIEVKPGRWIPAERYRETP